MIKNPVLTAALVLAAAAAPVHAGDPGQADALMKEAAAAVDAGACFRTHGGCPDAAVFPAAAAKIERAYALDRTPERAKALCNFYGNSVGRDRAWAAQQRGGLHRIIGLCQYGGASSPIDYLRSSLREQGGEEAFGQRSAAAARALFGAGLRVDRAGGRVAIDWGELDAATAQAYAAEFYAQHAPAVLSGYSDDTFLWPERKQRYLELGERRKLGWVLAEPKVKLALCERIMGRVTKGGGDAVEFCRYHALLEANAPRFAFRGQPVDYPAAGAEVSGLADGDAILQPGPDGRYSIAFTVAGGEPIDDFRHMRFQKAVMASVRESSPYHRDALAELARAERVAKQRQAAFARADQALRGGGKAKVVFAQAPFAGWDLPPILGKGEVADCDALHYKAYAPKKRGAEYEAEIAVDGEACSTVWVYSPEDASARVDSLMRPSEKDAELCPRKLAAPGEHQVAIAIYQVKAARTGRREITDDLKIRDEYMGVRGAKAGSFTARCATR
jgi:hypothetical protein